jgi:hypothetical protein
MREYWAKKKTQAKKPAPASAKVRTKTGAQKKALSLEKEEGGCGKDGSGEIKSGQGAGERLIFSNHL